MSKCELCAALERYYGKSACRLQRNPESCGSVMYDSIANQFTHYWNSKTNKTPEQHNREWAAVRDKYKDYDLCRLQQFEIEIEQTLF